MGQILLFLEALTRYQYLQNAMVTGVLVGIVCGVTGCFIILKGMALMGDAISHAVLPGVALAYMYGCSYFLGALFTGILTALGIGYVAQNSKLKDDTAMGIMFSAAFALGIVLITARRGTGVDLWHILFGNVLTVASTDLVMIGIITFLVLSTLVLFYKQLLLSTFDPVMAQVVGMPIKMINYSLIFVLALVTVASLKTVGIVLVVAMLITPGATAYLLTNRFPVMLFLSAVVGVISSVAGVYLSFIYDVATGASIVLVASILFAASFILSTQEIFDSNLGSREN